MKTIATILAGTVLALGIAGPAAAETRAEKANARLEKMLEGREAGEPQSCIATMRSNGLEVLDGTALVYKSGDTIWVNRPRTPSSLDSSDILVIDRFTGSQLCRTDQLHTVDRTGGFLTDIVFLEDFVPYSKKS